MKKLNIVLIVALFIVSAAFLITSFGSKTAVKGAPSSYAMECETVARPMGIKRCVNQEAICYWTGNGLSCFQK